MEVQTEFLWDEKNYTEQKTNCESKSEQEISDTTNDIKTNSTQVDWRDITDPKLRRKMYKKAYGKIYSKNWYQANKDKVRKRRQNNKEKIREQKKSYCEANKARLTEKAKIYYETNKNKIRDRQKKYREANKEKIKKQKKIEYETNKEKYRINYKNYKNKRNVNRKNRWKIDVQYKLSETLRSRLKSAIKNNSKSGSAVKDLGCTINELKIYLESKFQEGMNWDNWGLYGWHIDHIKPLSLFDLTNKDQFLQACHYTNLQPLWAKDNLSKNNKIV